MGIHVWNPILGTLSDEDDCAFKASLGYKVRSCLNNKNRNNLPPKIPNQYAVKKAAYTGTQLFSVLPLPHSDISFFFPSQTSWVFHTSHQLHFLTTPVSAHSNLAVFCVCLSTKQEMDHKIHKLPTAVERNRLLAVCIFPTSQTSSLQYLDPFFLNVRISGPLVSLSLPLALPLLTHLSLPTPRSCSETVSGQLHSTSICSAKTTALFALTKGQTTQCLPRNPSSAAADGLFEPSSCTVPTCNFYTLISPKYPWSSAHPRFIPGRASDKLTSKNLESFWCG